MEVPMRTLWLSSAVFVVLACSSGDNRRGGDTGMADSAAGGLSSHDTMPSMSDSGVTTGAVSGNTAATPVGILSELNVANTTEIQLSTLASKKASSAQVKAIARKLATDHTRNREQVRALAQKLDVTLTPKQGGSVSAADSAAMPADLEGKSGADFDQAFVQHEIQDHQANIDRIQSQILPSVQNDQIKSYLQKTVTEMQGHLSSLKQVQQQLGS
jgi:putative membrane protein